MKWLELRIPPPWIFALAIALMWGLSRISPSMPLDTAPRYTWVMLLGLLGAVCGSLGVYGFRHAQTTLDPRQPRQAAKLVTTGVYRYSRNPMYLGLLLWLLAYALWLQAPFALIGPAVFMAYITVFQIKPEEAALAAMFGDAYHAYTRRTRRWL